MEEQYTLFPAYRDTFYEYSGDSLSFYILMEGTIIYQGKAYKRPGENIRININKIAKDYISQSLPDFRGGSDVIYQHPEAFRIFRLYRADGTLLKSYGVLFDWEGDFGGEYPFDTPEEELAFSKILSDPIKPNVSKDMVLPITVFGGFYGVTTDTECPACELCSQLDEFDGQYLYFRGTGSFINNSAVTAYTKDEEYSTTAVTAAPAEYPSAYLYNLPSDPVIIRIRRDTGIAVGERLIFPESVRSLAISGSTSSRLSSYGVIGGKGVEIISGVTFSRTNVKKIWFPSLKEGYLNCNGCTSLTEVCLPSLVPGAGFSGCTSLTEVDLPSGKYCSGFVGCTNLQKVHISFSGASITGLEGISASPGAVFDGGVLGGWAFSGCTSLTSATFENALYYTNALVGCESLSELNIPNLFLINAEGGRSYLENFRLLSGFYMCNSLKTLYLPKLERIYGGEAFHNCANLEEIYVPNLKIIASGAPVFDYDPDTESLFFNNRYPTFYNLPKLKSLSLPSLKVICADRRVDYATIGQGLVFAGITQEELRLPNLEYIGGSLEQYNDEDLSYDYYDWASFSGGRGVRPFYKCHIDKIYLPKIKAISGDVFIRSGASYIYLGKTLEYLGSEAEAAFSRSPFDSGMTIDYEGTVQEWVTGVTFSYDGEDLREPPYTDPDDMETWPYYGVSINCADGVIYFRARHFTQGDYTAWGYMDNNGVWYEKGRIW